MPPQLGKSATETNSGDAKATAPLPGAEPNTRDRATPLPRKIGRFEVRGWLGSGAFGDVYRAYDSQLDREVALKVAKPGTLDTQERVGRFLREAKSAANLRHPNIVPLYETGRDGDRLFIASAFIDGRTLEAVIQEANENGKLIPLDDAARIVRKLADALAYAHAQGVVHRDVKPANVMVDEQGEPLLLDFGLAARTAEEGAERLTQDGQGMGTPAYMAPEQADGHGVAASDQYSLGCTLYELLTGRTPFAGGPAQQIFLHRTQPAPSARARREVPRDLDTVAQKCAEKEPARRYASCAELAEDLRRFLDREPVKARRIGPLERFGRWCKRNPAVAGSMSFGLLALLIGLVVALAQRDEARWQAKLAGDAAASEASQKKLADEKADLATKEAKRADLKAEEAARSETTAKNALDNFKRESQRRELTLGMGLYARDIARAAERYSAHDIGSARRLLATTPPEMRGWEWEYLDRQCRRKCREFVGAVGTSTRAVYSPDGRKIFCTSGNGIRVLDAESGAELRTLAGHTGSVLCLAVSADGRWVASGGSDKAVRFWDACSGAEVRTIANAAPKEKEPGPKKNVGGLKGIPAAIPNVLGKKYHHSEISGLCFSPDGRRLVSVGRAWLNSAPLVQSESLPGEVKVWDVRTGQEVLNLAGHTDTVHGVAYSPDGRRIAAGGDDKRVPVWDAETGKLLFHCEGHSLAVTSVCFAPRGDRIWSGSRDDTVRVWDAVTGGELLGVKLPGASEVVSLSADGQQLICGGPIGQIVVSDARTGHPLSTLTRRALPTRSGVRSLCFSPNGRHILSAGESGELAVWDVQVRAELYVHGGPPPGGKAAAMSPDGTRIAGGASPIRVWDAATGRELLALRGSGSAVGICFNHDGSRIATVGDGAVRVWDARTGSEVFSIKGHRGFDRSVSFSPDGRKLAAAWDNVVRVWDGQTGVELERLDGRSAALCIAFSPDGQQIAAGYRDRKIRVWDVGSGKIVRGLDGAGLGVTAVCYRPDGRRLLSATGDLGSVVLEWDAQTGEQLKTLWKDAKVSISSLAFSPDGKQFVAGLRDSVDQRARGEVVVCDADTGRPIHVLHGHEAHIECASYSPDGARILTCEKGAIKLWDARSGAELPFLAGHSASVTAVRFSPDGKYIASAGDDLAVRLWEVGADREFLVIKGHSARVTGVCFSPDGRRVASSSEDKTVRVWDARGGESLLTLTDHACPVAGVCFSPDGKLLASGGEDGVVRVRDSLTGREVMAYCRHKHFVTDLCFSPDGRRVASSCARWVGTEAGVGRVYPAELRVWEVATGQDVAIFTSQAGSISTISFGPDGRLIAGAGHEHTVSVWNVESGREEMTVRTPAPVFSVCISPDGRCLVTGGGDDAVRVWDVGTGQELFSLQGHGHTVTEVCFNREGTQIASCSVDRTVRVWDAEPPPGPKTLKGHSLGVTAASPSRDGRRVVSGSFDGTARVWEAGTGRELVRFGGSAGTVTSVCFSPDGRRVVSGGTDKMVRVWDAQTGKELLALSGPIAAVTSVCFSPDGRRVAGGSADNTVRIWDAHTGKELLSLAGHSDGVLAVTYSPCGRWLASGGHDRSVRLYEAEGGRHLHTLSGHDGPVSDLCFSSDGNGLASGCWDRSVKLWDVPAGRERRTIPGPAAPAPWGITNQSAQNGNPGATCVAFSPDGAELAVSHKGLDQVLIIDAQTGRQLRALAGHRDTITSLHYDPSLGRLISSSIDHTVKIWDPTSLTGGPQPAVPSAPHPHAK